MNEHVERARQLFDTTTQFPVLAVASFVAGPAVAAATLDRFGAVLPPEATSVVEEALVVLGWSSLRVFRGLDVAFDRIHGEAAASRLRHTGGCAGSSAACC